MLLFDLIDALERRERGDSVPPSRSATPVPPLPFQPGAPRIVPNPSTPPIVPWPPGMEPPFGGAPMRWPGMPMPRRPALTLMDLLLRNGLPLPASAEHLSSPVIPVSAAVPAVDERSSPDSADESYPYTPEETALSVEESATSDEPMVPEEPSRLTQAPTPQSKSDLPSPPLRRPWPRRKPGEPYSKPMPEAAQTIAPRTVAIPQEDGSFEIRKEGTKTWRNNNPGALKYRRDEVARANGAVGVDDDGFAIFPSYEAGKAAALESLRKKTGTLDRAIEVWAPKNENDTARYKRFIQSQTGLSDDTRLDTLTQSQIELVYNAIKRFEGWKPGEPPRRVR